MASTSLVQADRDCNEGNSEWNSNDDEYREYITLYRSALQGNWFMVKAYLMSDQRFSLRINSKLETTLHVAIQGGEKAIHFVQFLVEKMTVEDLECKTIDYQTVLIYAAGAGNTQAARILVTKHRRLLYMFDRFESLPVHVAADSDHMDTFQYLLSETLKCFSSDTEDVRRGVRPFADMYGLQLVIQVIIAGYYERQRLQDKLYKVLAFLVPPIKHIGEKKKKHCQAVKLVNLVCQTILIEFEYETIVKGPLLSAAKFGVREVVEQILQSFPDAILCRDNERRSVLDLAILHRQAKVFNLLCRMCLCKNVLSHRLDMEGNSILHLAGTVAPRSKLKLIPGAVLQMQREMQWFQVVEKFLPPKFRLKENENGETPAARFSAQHENLVREGEFWMRGVANSCTIVASLIATVAFAAAITVPGGNHGDTGLPFFSKESAFIVFAFSNALSLFTAATSLLMFLSIFTSRYRESDFLYVLPKRLIIGLVTLFLSITTMMIAFTAVLCLVAGKHKEKILIPTAAVASVPIYIFTSLQFPLLLDLIYSTYGSIFCKINDQQQHI